MTLKQRFANAESRSQNLILDTCNVDKSDSMVTFGPAYGYSGTGLGFHVYLTKPDTKLLGRYWLSEDQKSVNIAMQNGEHASITI